MDNKIGSILVSDNSVTFVKFFFQLMRKFFIFFISLFINTLFSQTVTLYNPDDNSVYPNEQFYCSGETFNLKVDAVATSTGDYQRTKESPANYPLSAGSTPITFSPSGSNIFSNAIPIGFNFSFYGKTYTKVVMGSNGRLVFTNDPALDNLSDITIYKDRTFSGITGYNTYSVLPSTDYNKVYVNNPTQELNMAQIFFGYTDLIPKSQNNSVTYLYKPIVHNGINGLLLSFQNQIRTNGVGGISSVAYYSNIIIFEDGKIVVYVNNKTESSYNAILGIQNENASKFLVADHSNASFNYNNGPWTSEGVAWVFTPNQTLTPQIKWFRNGTLLPETSNTLSNFAPNNGDIVKVEVRYLEDPSRLDTDQVTFRSVKTPVIEKEISGCSIKLKVNAATFDPGITYHWYRVGDTNLLGTGPEILLNPASAPDDYFAVPIRTGGVPCTASNKITIKQFFPSPVKTQLTICDNSSNPAPTTAVNLYTEFYPLYSPALNTEEYEVGFFDQSGVQISNPATFSVPANQHTQISIRRKLKGQSAYCAPDISATIDFISIANAINIPVCYSTATFDLQNYFKTQYSNISYQFTFTNSDGTSVGNPTSVDVTKSYFVKTTVSGGTCSTTTTVNFTQGSSITVPPVPVQEKCSGSQGNPADWFDLNIVRNILDPAGNYTIKFYRKTDNTEIVPGSDYTVGGLFWSGKLGDYVIYAKVFDLSDPTCFAVSNDIILRVNVRPKAKSGYQNLMKLKACGNSTVDLTIGNVFDVIENIQIDNTDFAQIPTMKYFDAAGTELTGSEITNYNISRGIPYLEIQNGACLPPLKLYYQLITTPFPLTNPPAETLCDDSDGNADGKIQLTIASNEYKSRFTPNYSDATFTYYVGTTLIHTSNSLNDPFTYQIVENTTITVKVSSPDYCENQSSITFHINSPTEIQLGGNINLCFGEMLQMDVLNFADFTSIQWLDPQGNVLGTTGRLLLNYSDVLIGQTYKVVAENANGCTSEITFVPSDQNQPKIETINQTNNSIEVIATGGVQPYTYYFNGVPQSSNILYNPTATSYVIQVESANGCMGEPKTVYFLKIHNAFTPNDDGINDYWTIENLDKMENISLIITDRFGSKVFETTNKNNLIWDGKSKGRILPTSSYWYNVSWLDPVTQKTEQRQGWIVLKNRN